MFPVAYRRGRAELWKHRSCYLSTPLLRRGLAQAAMRCFFPGYGILEDPVTGSAAGQLGALIQLLQPAELPRRLVFTQGDEMGRPGRIDVEVRADAATVRGWIGGNAVTILRGELEL